MKLGRMKCLDIRVVILCTRDTSKIKNIDKKKLIVTLELLDNVSIKYPETANYIEGNIKKGY